MYSVFFTYLYFYHFENQNINILFKKSVLPHILHIQRANTLFFPLVYIYIQVYLDFHTLNINDRLIAPTLCFMIWSKIIKSAIPVITLPFAISLKKGGGEGCVQIFPLFYLHPINNCYWSFNYAPVIAELWLTCVIFLPGDAL